MSLRHFIKQAIKEEFPQAVNPSAVAGAGKLLVHVNNGALNTQAFAAAVWNKLTTCLNTVVTNSLSEWNGTNNRFIPSRVGTYSIFCAVQLDYPVTSGTLAIYKNGSTYATGSASGSVDYGVCSLTANVVADTPGDFFEVFFYPRSVTNILAGEPNVTLIKVFYVGSPA